jgi:hypothetical protein
MSALCLSSFIECEEDYRFFLNKKYESTVTFTCLNETDHTAIYVVPRWKEIKGEETVLNKLSYRTPKALDIPLAGKAEIEVLSTASHTI